MGTIPVSKPTPPRSWRFSRRIVPLALMGAAALVGGLVALAIGWPSGVTAPTVVDAGNVEDLPAGEPVHFEHGFFLVLLESGEVIALSDRDTHVFGENPDCPVTWRPEITATGVLRGTCSGGTFTVTGERLWGPSPRGLDRHPIQVSGSGQITVDLETRLCAPDYTAASCP